MNLSVSDVGASLLVVSQFTLLGDARRGSVHRSMGLRLRSKRENYTNIL